MAAHSPLLLEALRRHQAGDFQGADALYRSGLAGEPMDADAWHLPGLLFHQRGCPAEARTAIAREPGNPDLHYDPGVLPRPLARQLATLPGVTRVVVRGEPLPPADLQCPLICLPHRAGTTLAAIPAAVPYLFADPLAAGGWRERLEADRGARSCYRGGYRRGPSCRCAGCAGLIAQPVRYLLAVAAGAERQSLVSDASPVPPAMPWRLAGRRRGNAASAGRGDRGAASLGD